MYLLPIASPVAPRRHAALNRELRAFDRLFERSLPDAPTTRTPAMDVAESDTAYTVEFEVPGATREELDVSIDGRRVTLRTVDVAPSDASYESGAPAVQAQSKALYLERNKVAYARTVSLPAEVDSAASHARFENGVLTLTLAKKVRTGATKLSIG